MLRQPISKPIRTGWHVAVILAVSSSVLFTNLGGPRLWDRDEPRNAGCAQEMLQRGDWVVPFFNAELRAHKPVLLYWLMMSAYQVLGVTEFAARFWSAVLGVGTVFLTYGIGRRLFDAHVGLWAALILATSLMFGVAGRAATPDSPLIFFATAALLVYVLAAFPGDSADLPHRSQATQSDLARRTECSEFPLVKPPGPGVSNRWVAVAIYGLMGLAVLAKGPVGAVLPTAVIGMFLLIMRLSDVAQGPARPAWQRWLVRCLRPFAPQHFFGTCWQMRPLTAIAVILAVAAPWYIWVAGGRTASSSGSFSASTTWGAPCSRWKATAAGLGTTPWRSWSVFFPGRCLQRRSSPMSRRGFGNGRFGGRATSSPFAGSGCTWVCFRWLEPNWPATSRRAIPPWRC